jgi:hypothetical protein
MALLLNTRSSDEGFDLGEPLREIVKAVKNWPSIDLF